MKRGCFTGPIKLKKGTKSPQINGKTINQYRVIQIIKNYSKKLIDSIIGCGHRIGLLFIDLIKISFV